MLHDLAINLTIGLGMIVLTFIIHAIGLDRLLVIIQLTRVKLQQQHEYALNHQITILLMTTLGIILIHSLEIWAWALLYDYLDIHAVGNLETALYFSTVSFSTVGYGDVVLDPSWRMLGAMQAASGMILFGWSTATIFEVIRLNYPRIH
jgi:voltage-gated potassium channel